MSASAVISGPRNAPPVLLIHGLASSHHVWDRVLPLLEPVARVHAVDLAGTSSIGDDADAVAALISTPMPIVGHSRGGLVATAIAERHPHLVRKLILLCPPWSMASRRVAHKRAERAIALPLLGNLIWALASTSRQRAALRSAFGPTTSEVPDQFLTDLRRHGRRGLVESSRAIDTYLTTRALTDRLGAIDVASDIVFGALDARIALPADEFATLHAATVTVLPGSGHTPPWEAPEPTADIIISSLPRR
jgi:pimeloyl-ACP methyl ester carboxylesterase